MVNFPHTQIPWQIVPRKLYHMANVPHEGIPYGKPSPGRNSKAELSQVGIIPYWQTFPLYDKSPPAQIPYVILGQHVRFLLGRGGGGRNPIDGELLSYGILSGGRKSMGGSHVTPGLTSTCLLANYLWASLINRQSDPLIAMIL